MGGGAQVWETAPRRNFHRQLGGRCDIDENAPEKIIGGDAINALALGMFDCVAARHISIETSGHEALLQSTLWVESIYPLSHNR